MNWARRVASVETLTYMALEMVTDGDQPIIYLDTNHISRLVRDSNAKDVKAVRAVFDGGDAALGVSVFHMLELCHPNFKSREEVGDLLDSLPLRWVEILPNLHTKEINRAFARAIGGQDGSVRAFYPKMTAAWGMPEKAYVAPSRALELMARKPGYRAGMEEQVQHSKALDRLKGAAAIVQRPLEPLEGMIRDRKIFETPSGIRLPVEYPPEEVIARAGGLAGFPSYQVYHGLFKGRLGDARYDPEENDIVDEWHACHGPYVAVLAVDRRTAGRIKSAKLAMAEWTTAKIKDVPGLLADNAQRDGAGGVVSFRA